MPSFNPLYHSTRRIWLLPVLLLLGMLTTPVAAAELSDYDGGESCVKCHKLIYNKTYTSNTHNQIFTNAPRNEKEARGCEACHGPAARHVEIADNEEGGTLALNSFKPAPENTPWINNTCLSCHQGGMHIEHWSGSAHQTNGLACTSCHRMHNNEKKVAQQVCGNCHVRQRAKMNRSSHIPARGGQMSCTSCHNAHGSAGEAALTTTNANDSCYQCHAEQRGPFLWEHAPVRDNCGNCHDPHGSNHDSMLKMRQPFLCQSCHLAASPAPHTSNLMDGRGTVPGTMNRSQVVDGCGNCHSLIHGSNHPSGNTFQR
ncbi:MAG: DmsE family decaheme c-type cytochrome [Sulfurimicrobium sp.]|nr:DmsE family decaheme c-type cytochrome [Sulfurimicrobium sp.]